MIPPLYNPGDRVRRPHSFLSDVVTTRRWVPSPYAVVVRHCRAIVLPTATGGYWRYEVLSGDWCGEAELESHSTR